MPIISVIIPVYNVERYLRQCIDSVLTQGVEDIEVILVNDGSTDNSGNICDEYARKDRRIKVIHKENGGLSDARNTGIKYAMGKYILFLDSDDYWMKDSLKEIIKCIKDDVDVVFLTVGKLFEKTNEITQKFECLDKNSIKNKSKKEVFEYLARADKFPVAAWDKLIKKDIIVNNNLFFEKGLLSEDIDWTTQLLLLANKFDVCEANFYVYRKQREGSITSSIKLKNITDIIYILKKWLQKCENREVEENLIQSLLALHAYEYIILMGHIYSIDINERKKVIKEIESLKVLLSYSSNKKTKIIKNIERLIGFKATSKLLNMYINRKS